MKKNVYLFLFNGYSDWEIGYLMPELHKCPKYNLITFSINGEEVISAGGLKVRPDCSLDDVDMDSFAFLILPGGNAWEEKGLKNINSLIKKVHEKHLPLAAICGATVGLADNGVLNSVHHTSNAKEYLKAMSAVYSGEELYRDERAVTDGNIITASGIAPIEFAMEVFLKLQVFDVPVLEKWYRLFKNGILEE